MAKATLQGFKFPCRACGHSAYDHSSKTGPRDMHCHLESCGCEKYGSWALDSLKSRGMWVRLRRDGCPG